MMTTVGVDADAIIPPLRTILRPPRRLRLSEWADEHFYLSAESAADPGRWHTLPYQRGILDAITDPVVTQVSVMKSARIGYTKCINAAIGYYIHQDPCPIMVVQPTIEDAQGYSKEEIAPMLRDCPALTALVPEPKTRDSDNTILLKRFLGGSLSIIGANSARGFRRVSRKVVIFDEVDGYPPSAGTEGDQIQLGRRRSEYYWDRKIVLGSSPGTAGTSRIEAEFLAGDQRRYYVPCPHCGTFQILQFPHFKWPKGRPDLAVYVCLSCGAEIDHRHKRDMVTAGEWRAGPHAQFAETPAPTPFDGHASFHIWAAYSFSPNATWGQLCKEFVKASGEGPEHLKTFVNTGLGETWKDRGDAPAWRALYDRRDMYAMGSCPSGVLFLTCGVDVQKDRLVYEIVGWGRDKRSWSIEIGILPGATADETRGPWPALEAFLGRTYKHAAAGSELPIAMLAIDSAYNTQAVYAWARKFQMSRVIAVRGVATSHVLLGAPSRVDLTRSGKRLKGGYKVWPIGTGIAKSELYGWLALEPPTTEAVAAGEGEPAGFCHFPEYDEEFFRQLTAEQLVSRRGPGGYPIFIWELIPGRQNHYLDTRVYARAAAAAIGLDRFRDADFATLEGRLGVAPPAAPPVAASAPVAAPPAPSKAPASPTPARHPARGSWLGPRKRSWLK